jgi:hypothetical protein
MIHRYSTIYHQLCQQLEAYAQARAGRPLTAAERQGIWNAGSVTLLRVVADDLSAAPTPDAVSSRLATLASAAAERIQHTRASLAGQLQLLLGRALAEEELHYVATLSTMYAAMRLVEHLMELAPEQREAHWQQILGERRSPV